MPTDPHLDPEENVQAQMGYETEDVEFKSLGRSIIWFFGFVVFCGVSGVLIFTYFLGGPSKLLNPPADTTPMVNRLPESPNPLLQTNTTARTDIKELRQHENELLHGKPSWVDQSKGIVRIPIEQAVDRYLSSVAPTASKETTIQSGAPPVAAGPEEGAESNTTAK